MSGIAAVVVTYESASTIGECLDRLRAADGVVQIRVVDNASGDDTVAIIQRHATADPRVRFIANPDNPGFGSACNQGVAAADAEVAGWVALVNPDLMVEPDTLARIVALAREHGDPNRVLLGADLVGEDGARDPAARRRDPDFGAMLRALLSGGGSTSAAMAIPPDDRLALQPVEAISGALMLMPRAMYERLGGFDEGYRLHAEDLDLCRRAREAGALVAVANQAMVNSQVDAVVRLVHHQQLADPSSPDNFEVISAMRQALAGDGQPPFAGLDQLRAQHGADVVVWTWPHDIDTRGSCGVAYLPDDSNGDYDASAAAQITNDGTSNWSVCSNDVFTHELGHNLGAVHQGYPGAPDSPAYAWVEPGRFNTVMGSFGSNHADRFRRLPLFSNPDILCGGAPCGSSTPGQQANQALVLNTMAPIVAGYATATVPGQVTAPPPSHPDSDGDGVSDWLDPYPFDPDNGNPPPQPPLPAFSPLAILPGDGPDQLQLLVANSGSDQVLAYTASGRPMGLVAQAVATNPRPLISEHSDLDVDDDGRLVLLANGDVQHYSRERGQFLGTWKGSFNDGVPPTLHNGFPRAMGYSPDRSQLVVIGDYAVERFAPDGIRLNITTSPVDINEPENWNNYMPLPLRAFAFGAGNRFYLADSLGNRIMSFDTVSGARLGDASAGSPDLIQDPRDLVIGPDGAVYLADGSSDRILRFPADGSSPGSVFVAAGAGGLSFARALAFGPDGHLYVASRSNQRILRYDGASGAFLDVFIDGAGLDHPESLRFTPKLDLIFRDGLEGD